MSRTELHLSIAIQEVAIKDADDKSATDFLCGFIKEATLAALRGNQREIFGFSDEFDSDVVVRLSDEPPPLDSKVQELLQAAIETYHNLAAAQVYSTIGKRLLSAIVAVETTHPVPATPTAPASPAAPASA